VRLLEGVQRAARLLAAALLAGVVVLVSYSAIARYFFSSPIRFAEEVTGLLMIGLLFLAIGGAGRPAHLRVGILADALPRRWRRVFGWIALAVLVLFCVVFGWEAVKQTLFNYQRNIRSEIVGWWLFPWTALIPLALLVVVVDALIRELRGEEAKGEARDGT
jgi:TRAP-type C4-dicarboxylate transport system permease small subunit